MGYLGVDFPLGQDAANMAPPTMVRKAPAQAMKMAEPNSYLHRGKKKKTNIQNGEELLHTETGLLLPYFHLGSTLKHLLGINWGERVVEGSDDVVGIPGTGNDGTQSCRKKLNLETIENNK